MFAPYDQFSIFAISVIVAARMQDHGSTPQYRIEPSLGEHNFDAMRHDVTFPLYVEVNEIYNLACPASPICYQHDSVQTTKEIPWNFR